ncbi:MAG: trypsin-like serine peptidase [Cypionkella sp.]
MATTSHRKLRNAALLIGLVLASAGALGAQGETRPVSDAEAARWHGVGVLVVSGHNVCSAALISATEAITAAHCVYARKGQKHTPPAEMELTLGLRQGNRVAVRGVRAVAVLPGFVAAGPRADLATLPWDIALLVLDAPVPLDVVRPFEVADWQDLRGSVVTIIGYEHVRPDEPMLRDGCGAIERHAGVTTVGCDVVGGLSGAPVLLRLNANNPPLLVAEVSSRGAAEDGEGLAYVVSVAPHLAELRALIAQ